MKHLPLFLILLSQITLSSAQSHSSFPLDITCRTMPQQFRVSDTTRLAYELHVVNYAPRPVELSAINVFNAHGSPIAFFDSSSLSTRIAKAETLLSGAADTNRTIESGHAAVLFIDLSLSPHDTIPSVLQHKITCITGAGHSRSFIIQPVTVNTNPVPVLVPPVHGPGWIAFNAYGNTNHRRAYNPVAIRPA